MTLLKNDNYQHPPFNTLIAPYIERMYSTPL